MTMPPQRGVTPKFFAPTVRVLVVDDEAELMLALRDALTAHGFDTTGLTNPTTALDAIRCGEFDALLTDLSMPRMNGLELLRAARAIDPLLAVVIMTGDASVPAAVEAMKAGAIDFVLKPFKLAALLPAIRRGHERRWAGKAVGNVGGAP